MRWILLKQWQLQKVNRERSPRIINSQCTLLVDKIAEETSLNTNDITSPSDNDRIRLNRRQSNALAAGSKAQSMDHHDGLPKWTTLMDCQMDYVDGLPNKIPWKQKNRKKYHPLVVCFDRFTAIRHLDPPTRNENKMVDRGEFSDQNKQPRGDISF